LDQLADALVSQSLLLSGMEFEIADERGQVVLRVPIQEIGDPDPQEMRAQAA
jgi:uncharacterized protein YxjI